MSQLEIDETVRPTAYELLAWGLTYPTASMVADLADWQAVLAETFAAVGLPAAGVGEALAALPQAEADRRQALQIEYTRLFINGVPHVLAPPYASAYANTGLLLGQPAEAALRTYREAGLVFAADTHELPDHIAATLEFMGYLGRQELAARHSGQLAMADQWLERQRNFLAQLLLPWTTTWQARVVEHDRTDFYAALARLVVAWLQTEANRLERI